MNDFIEKLKAMDKKQLGKIVFLLVLGVFLMVFSSIMKKNDDKTTEIKEENQIIQDKESYEKELENKLISILSQVNGVGEVDVLITIAYSEELVIAEDGNKTYEKTKEKDVDGGEREVIDESSDMKNVIIQDGGKSQALVLKEIRPKIEGVLIVAQGGGSSRVVSDLTNVATVLLDVEVHKVSVLKMK